MNMRQNPKLAVLLAVVTLAQAACSQTNDTPIPLPEPTRVSAVPATSSAPTPPPAAAASGQVTPIRIEIVFLPPPLPPSVPVALPTTSPPVVLPPPTPAPTQPVTESRVIVYGTSWCVHCGTLRRELAARGVPHAYVDLDDKVALTSRDGQYAREIPENMRNAVPVTRVVQRNGQAIWVHGNNPAGVERAYRG